MTDGDEAKRSAAGDEPEGRGRPQRGVPPAGEEIHMPRPSIIPIINAAALSIAIVGVTLSWVLVAAGLIVFLATAARWIADTRRDIAELPLEHRHH